MTIENPALAPDWMPSLIIGRQKSVTIPCGPHQTPFTATTFGWCYGTKVGDDLMSFDPADGELVPVNEVLPEHSEFSLFADVEDGFELECIAKHIALIEKANRLALCSQAILANEVTTQLAEWGNAGAPDDIGSALVVGAEEPTGPIIRHQDGTPITDGPTPRRSMDLRLCRTVNDAYCHVDLEHQILWLAPELAPLVDSPALEFDARLRAQLKRVYPEMTKDWAVVTDGVNQGIIKASRNRDGQRLETFINTPHASCLYGPYSPVAPYDGTIELTQVKNTAIIDTGHWRYEAEVSSENDQTIRFEFDAICWSHLAVRPDLRSAIAAQLRAWIQHPGLILLAGPY